MIDPVGGNAESDVGGRCGGRVNVGRVSGAPNDLRVLPPLAPEADAEFETKVMPSPEEERGVRLLLVGPPRLDAPISDAGAVAGGGLVKVGSASTARGGALSSEEAASCSRSTSRGVRFSRAAVGLLLLLELDAAPGCCCGCERGVLAAGPAAAGSGGVREALRTEGRRLWAGDLLFGGLVVSCCCWAASGSKRALLASLAVAVADGRRVSSGSALGDADADAAGLVSSGKARCVADCDCDCDC